MAEMARAKTEKKVAFILEIKKRVKRVWLFKRVWVVKECDWAEAGRVEAG